MHYPVKDLMREITRATCGTVAQARSVVRYLAHKPFPAGAKLEYLDVYVECDWAAHHTERKSRNCVVTKLGPPVLETSSTTQGVILLSSGEAELYAATRAAACSIQMQSFLTETGCPHPLRVHSRFSRSSRHDAEAWIWPGEASRYQCTLVPGGNRERGASD